MKIYQIDSSARKEGSSSRALAKKLLDKIKKPGDEVIYRDLDDDMLFVSGLTESGMKIAEKDQTEEHKKMFELSDKLVSANQSENGFSEYKYTAENTPQFNGFQIKIVMTSPNQSEAPRIKNLRAIALRTFESEE